MECNTGAPLMYPLPFFRKIVNRFWAALKAEPMPCGLLMDAGLLRAVCYASANVFTGPENGSSE